jgi:hypothetical protein
MRKLFVLCITLAVCGCQQEVRVPTTDELMANPQILAEWQTKCDSGEYSHLPADQKDRFCFTTREAARSIAIKKMYAQ